MTNNLLIFLKNNETCLAFRHSTKCQTCSNLYFFDYLPMAGFTRTEQCPAFAETPALSTS